MKNVFSVNEYVSNLPLQMSLYFNALFFPLWWVALVAMLEAKVSDDTERASCER